MDGKRSVSGFMLWCLLWTVVLVVLVGAVGGCRDLGTPMPPPDNVQPAPDIRSHPLGTFLLDRRGRFWKVAAGPERSIVSPLEMDQSNLSAQEAIRMSAEEESCLRITGRAWQGRTGWQLGLVAGEPWYISQQDRIRRRAFMPVIQAWHDDPSHLPEFTADAATWERGYRDQGPMAPPDGAFFRAEQDWYVFWDGALHRFSDEHLLEDAGYHPEQAVRCAMSDLTAFGQRGDDITAETFSACPAQTPRPHSAEDEDGDGVARGTDCDDHDARRAPGFVELCDGIDNDCNGQVDDGFPLRVACTVDDACQTPGITTCGTDGWTVSCTNDDADCDQ